MNAESNHAKSEDGVNKIKLMFQQWVPHHWTSNRESATSVS